MLYALVMGVFWGTWFAQSRTMDILGAATFLENGRMYIANLALPMRILMPSCPAVTLGVNVPLDFQFKSWTLDTLPADRERLRDRWETLHRLRTWLSIVGFAAQSSAVLATRD